MATNIPLTGNFNVTCEYGRKGNWAAGFHTGIDLVSSNKNIYATCTGIVSRTGYDKSYGNFIVVKSHEDGTFHWYCHLSKILVSANTSVSRTSIIGIMGTTGNSTGVHLHFEIRKSCNCYGKVNNPADYMKIPNKVGSYNSANFQIKNNIPTNDTNKIYTLKSSTYLRSQPTIKSQGSLYIAKTTFNILERNVAIADGYSWNKVKIRANGKIGFMANINY